MLRYWRCLVERRTQGKRSERVESRGGDLKELKDKVKAFCERELALGHDVAGEDLLDEMSVEAEEAKWLLEPGEEARQLINCSWLQKNISTPGPVRSESSYLFPHQAPCFVLREASATYWVKQEKQNIPN